MASELYADNPTSRLAAAARLSARHRRNLIHDASDWPANSPGAINAWLLLVTTKPPTWRDPFVEWRELPPVLGDTHEGFLYPDPLGFWAEVRHWATLMVGLPLAETLSVTTLLHGPDLKWAIRLMQPHIVLFLDEPAWHESGMSASHAPHHIPDPHREGQVYEGWWGRTRDENLIVGKAPQHPAMHNLYNRADMDTFLRSRPD
jgi:hypothetical protein